MNPLLGPINRDEPTRTKVRVGVVGGGLIAQVSHLPYLAQMSDRFDVVAIVDPSLKVRQTLAARYGARSCYADHVGLIDAGVADAVVVCSPNGTHAGVVLDALEAGLHVFVEKPLCIAASDADRIIKAKNRSGKVVQVGYMKRFDPAYERMLAELPNLADDVRNINVVVYEALLDRYFRPHDFVAGSDIDERVVAESKRTEAEQVLKAVGSDAPEDVAAYSRLFLLDLVHDVNLVNGLLQNMGEPLPSRAAYAAWWSGSRAATVAASLSNGAVWNVTYVEVPTLHDYKEALTLVLSDSVRSLTFPAPYLKQSPSVYECINGENEARLSNTYRSYRESFARELEHFHECVTRGVECRTPPEQARLDLQTLTDMFLAGKEAKGELSTRRSYPASTGQ